MNWQSQEESAEDQFPPPQQPVQPQNALIIDLELYVEGIRVIIRVIYEVPRAQWVLVMLSSLTIPYGVTVNAMEFNKNIYTHNRLKFY